jgi:hypothetical protein
MEPRVESPRHGDPWAYRRSNEKSVQRSEKIQGSNRKAGKEDSMNMERSDCQWQERTWNNWFSEARRKEVELMLCSV